MRGHSRSSESLWLPFPSGPLSCEDPPPLPSPANCPVSGSRRHPPKPAAASFLPAGTDLLLCCPSSLPPVQCWSALHRAKPSGERRASCSQREQKGLLPSVLAPFPGRLSPASGGSPKATHLLRKSVENGSLLGSKCGCQRTALPSIHFLVGLGLSSIPHPRKEA